MKLKELKIELEPSYSDDAGKYKGRMSWEDKNDSEIRIILPPELSERLLLAVAPVLEEFSRQATQQFTAAISSSVLEARKLPVTVV